jgi:paraquat-inducible protein B
MARKGNPAIIGAFVLGGLALIIAGLVVLGGGKFFRQSQRWVLYFEGSIKGLNVGSPVTFRGVKIGSVTDIVVTVNRKNVTVRTPVFIEVEAARFREEDGRPIRFEKGTPEAALLIERGLRAQLELLSFVTGQLAIDVDFYPGTPIRLSGLTNEAPEVPTIQSPIEKLTQTIENLPLGELVQDIRRAAQAIERLADAPETREILRDTAKLVKNADQKVTRLSASVEDTLRDARALIKNLDGRVGPLATTIQEAVTKAEANLAEALADVRNLARNVDGRVGPLAEDFEKALRGAQNAFARAEVALAGLEILLEPGSPTAYNLNAALQSVGRAADSIRQLTDYLAQHPNALIFGRGHPGEQTR